MFSLLRFSTYASDTKSYELCYASNNEKNQSFKTSIKQADWKWYCRHRPQIAQCSECLAKQRNKKDERGLADDWNWWI